MRRRKWKKTLTTLLYTLLPMLVVGMFALPVQGLGIDVSDFNPIGKALDPIENLIPNFVIKGHIKQDIRRNIHGKSNSSGGTGHHGLFGSPVDIAAKEGRFRQWDWDQIWTTGELEMRWRPHPNVEIVNFWNQRYDAVFDLDHWWKDNQTKVIGGKE
ncbi:MAG: hypothetical protein QF619_10435, partial [Candidatus Binatia bacterium]|nr:hypothetical protein [Candidatus Binatia bacterium]